MSLPEAILEYATDLETDVSCDVLSPDEKRMATEVAKQLRRLVKASGAMPIKIEKYLLSAEEVEKFKKHFGSTFGSNV